MPQPGPVILFLRIYPETLLQSIDRVQLSQKSKQMIKNRNWGLDKQVLSVYYRHMLNFTRKSQSCMCACMLMRRRWSSSYALVHAAD